MRKLTTNFLTAALASALVAAAAAPALASPVPQSSAASSATPASAPASTATHKSSTTSSKKKKSSHRHSSKREPFQKAPTPDRISEIQTALSHGGYFQGDPNGKWDSNTVAAMQKFQSANGLNSSGKIDATTLQKLGLGSSTAGVDAPKPLRKSDPNATSANANAAARTTAAPANANSASNTTPAPTPSASTTKPPQR